MNVVYIIFFVGVGVTVIVGLGIMEAREVANRARAETTAYLAARRSAEPNPYPPGK